MVPVNSITTDAATQEEGFYYATQAQPSADAAQRNAAAYDAIDSDGMDSLDFGELNMQSSDESNDASLDGSENLQTQMVEDEIVDPNDNADAQSDDGQAPEADEIDEIDEESGNAASGTSDPEQSDGSNQESEESPDPDYAPDGQDVSDSIQADEPIDEQAIEQDEELMIPDGETSLDLEGDG